MGELCDRGGGVSQVRAQHGSGLGRGQEGVEARPDLPFAALPLSSFKGPEPEAISIPGNPQAICEQRQS